MSFLLTTSWNKLEEIIAWMLAEQGILLPYLQRIIFAAYQDWWEPIIIETKFCLNLLLGEKHKQLNKNQLSIISDEMQIITFFVVWTCLWSGISNCLWSSKCDHHTTSLPAKISAEVFVFFHRPSYLPSLYCTTVFLLTQAHRLNSSI